MMDFAPFVRIGLRIFAGYLIGRGMDPDTADVFWMDPELAGAITLAINEAWYLAARKFGWAK